MGAFCKMLIELCLQLNSQKDEDLEILEDLLFSHDFLLSRLHFEGTLKAHDFLRF